MHKPLIYTQHLAQLNREKVSSNTKQIRTESTYSDAGSLAVLLIIITIVITILVLPLRTLG